MKNIYNSPDFPDNEDTIILTRESQQKLEEALEERNKLLTNIEEAFFSVDMTSGKILILSDANEDIYGYSLDEMYANPNLWFEVIHPDDKKMIEEKMSLLAKGETTNDEHRIIRKDGKVIWVEGRVTPTLNKAGKIIRLDGVVADISKRKKAERLRDEKLNDLKTFMYKTTHDLKTPLSSMSGLFMLAEKEHTDLNQYLPMLKKCTARMETMLNDLTNIIETAESKVNADPIDFKEMIEEIKSSFHFTGDINFSLNIELNEPFHTDKRFLLAILQNLIDNAVKYKSILEKSFIHIHIIGDNPGVKIEIADNGIGIPTHLQKKIFDVFFRATELSKGTGLGLYIVKNNVQKLSGKITIKSEEGKGATFSIFLPDMIKYRLKRKKPIRFQKQLSIPFSADAKQKTKGATNLLFPNLSYVCQYHPFKMAEKPNNLRHNPSFSKIPLLPPPPRFSLKSLI